MPVKSELLLHSKSTVDGSELATFKIEVPLFAWIDILTHRNLSRNASSSRAIPLKKWRDKATNNPAIPTILTKYNKGMAANEPLDSETEEIVKEHWLDALDYCASIHATLESLGVSKQDANVLLYQFSHVQAIISATSYKNFFNLRCDSAAKPDVRLVAELMKEQLNNSQPQYLDPGEWHLPLLMQDESEVLLPVELRKISTARCARVSYYLPDTGKISDLDKDIELYERLLALSHLSPFEHIATPFPMKNVVCGNFVGWMQYRKLAEDEEVEDLPDNFIFLSSAQVKKLVKL